MNKQRFLAELQRLLVFMTEEDRELAIRHYGDIFDAAGEDGEAALVESLGSPTKAAIALSRGYEPGSIKNLPKAPASLRKPKAALTQTEDDPWGDLPTFEIPTLEEDTPMPEAEQPEEHESEAEAENKPISPTPEAPAWVEDEPDQEAEYDRPMPLGAGIALLTLVLIAIGIPLAAITLALMAVCLAPGAAVVLGAYLAAVGGLWCLGYMADAIMMFGLAFLVLAVGLIVLWGGIWLCSRLVKVYAMGVRWLCGELLGRKVTEDE